jgi:hypothetical protein
VSSAAATIVASVIAALAAVFSAWIATRPRRRALPPETPGSFTLTGIATTGNFSYRTMPERPVSHSSIGRLIDSATQGAARLFDPIWASMYWLPALPRKKSSPVAGLIGFLFGGIGLAIYLRSLVDLIVPIALVVVALILINWIGGIGWALGATISALYGFFRVESSNRRLAVREAVEPLSV